ncbi:OsmC family protein [Oceaniserpentilla sp. 4NH20-0058]|uniref:OsmC family protein n=1 Tax=Oceaniserpentilla sp. 4NH20-0058 TaxID=3127660 RepID=UPI003108DA1C
MSEHRAQIHWQRQGTFNHEGFERAHEAAISGHILPMAGANTEGYADPEQILAASLSSCHMQTFLLLAAKKRFQVESYEDIAIARLDKNTEGKQYVKEIELSPKVVFSGDKQPTTEEIEKMHHKAHAFCFINNSLISHVMVTPIF